MQGPIVILTDREGGRGMDYRVTSSVCVIIGCKDIDYLFLRQALGRGSRTTEQSAQGAVVVL
jgi:hypothetical protein